MSRPSIGRSTGWRRRSSRPGSRRWWKAVRAPLLAEGHRPEAIEVRRSVDVRYVGQNYELEVPWAGDLDGLRAGFHALHRRLYAYATDDAVECVNLRVRAGVEAAGARLPEWPTDGRGQPFTEHEAYFPETGPYRAPRVPAGGSSRPSIRSRARPSSRIPGPRPSSTRATPASSTAPGTCGWVSARTSGRWGSDCDGPTLRHWPRPGRSGNAGQSEPEPGHAGGRAPRDLRDRGGDEPHHHALRALTAPQGDGRSVERAHRRARPADRPGPRHPHPPRRDGFHGEGVPPARAAAGAPRRRRLVPEPPRGRRQPPARREGDPAGVRRRAARRLRHQPRPLGRHRRRRPGLVRAVGRRGRSRRASASRRSRCSTGRGPRAPSTSSCRTSAAGRSARATAAPCTRRSRSGPGVSASSSNATDRPRSSAASTATGPSRRPPCGRAIRGIPDGVYAGEDWVDDDGHEDRPVPVRVTVTVRGDRAAFDFTGTGAAVKGPVNATPFVTCLRGLLQRQVARRPRRPGERRLLPPHHGARARRARS